MIDPSTYGTAVSAFGAAPAITRAADDARHAADFARILNAPAHATAAATTQTDSGFSFLGFVKGLVDVINPLQHIPVVGTLYRNITGDEISPMARLCGNTLYGGAIGAAVAMADIACETATGKDIGASVMAALTPDKTAPEKNDGTMIASGTIRASDIVWPDASPDASRIALLQDTRLSLPPHPPTSTGGDEPGRSTPTRPVHPAKEVDSTTLLQAQEAPATRSRTDTAPELIAARMRDALDKYGQMKQTGLAPRLSAAY